MNLSNSDNPVKQAPLYPQGVAVVIGGSGGMGSIICQHLVKAGSGVVFTYHKNKQRAEELQQTLEVLANDIGLAQTTEQQVVSAVQLAIEDTDQVQALFDDIAAQHNIHTVVIASGYDIPQQMISEIKPDLWRSVINSDVNGFFNIVHAASPYLAENDGGSFVHLSSAGLSRWPERDALSVAPKACNEQLIKGIAKEQGRFGVRANSIAVGVIETGIFLRLWEEGVFDEAWKNKVQEGLCLKRWGTPDEIAEAVIFLSSRRGAYITGQMLALDGGYGV